MRFEWYTLPVLALLLFAGTLGVNVAEDATYGHIAREITPKGRAALFMDPAHSTAAAARAGDSRGLAGLWVFDEGEGVTVFDKSGHGHTGILKGNPQWVRDGDSTRLSFDGFDDYVLVDASAALNLGEQFTFSLWVNPEGDTRSALLSKDGARSDSEGGYFVTFGEGEFRYGIRNRAMAGVGLPEFGARDWVHLAVMYDATATPNTRFFVDGVHVLSSRMDSPEDNDAALLIGRDAEGNYFAGEMGMIRIYNRALKASEIQEIHSAHRDSDTSPETPTVTRTRGGVLGSLWGHLKAIFE